MPVNITTGRPMGRMMGHDVPTQVNEMQDLFCDLLDQLQFAIYNLDAGNVLEAQSVKAQNIDTKTAQITTAQIKNLKADKIAAGVIDLSKGITITGDDGNMSITQDAICMYDEQGHKRVQMGRDDDRVFVFELYNADGGLTLHLDEQGNAVFSGTVIGSEIEGGTVRGAVIETADNGGMKMILDENGLCANDSSGQKEGWCIEPTAVGGQLRFYANDGLEAEFERHTGDATLNLKKYNGGIVIDAKNNAGGEIKLVANKVLINGKDPLMEINRLENLVNDLSEQVNHLKN